MEDMEKELVTLRSQQDQLTNQQGSLQNQQGSLQNQQNSISALLGANEPITATTTFVDDNGVTRIITDTYSFKAGNNSTQYMTENGDGTFEIYIERFSDVEWYEGAWLQFKLDTSDGSITNQYGGHYWNDQSSYGDNAYFAYNYTPAPIMNITVNSINVATGDISVSFSATADGTYTTNYPWQAPNPGLSMTTTFSFSGKLKVFQLN